ncbi:4Fe-4S dicluster domain-containing protein [Hyperthermus butylicus]|uniref:4Fe-4S ferredoxin-type domain-containing protein n=1 Tax=Hyperthermus butylicus (strain DSM 5456 / JCM 9403 / PLM1-5) TaxID=415426 RepID=A2BMJ4_HYPBU|nr:4Fe-4S dicluster domain-containing protein [Hyperthermus butylicus]ABM81205.1 hypothetical protein Hbut_1380 [Hyperthermus butylicus DSM 5456]
MGSHHRFSMTRREFLKAGLTIAAVAAAAPVSRLLVGIEVASTSRDSQRIYYEFFDVTDDENRIEYYGALGFVIERDGRKCVANVLLPGRCITYTKPVWEDWFPTPLPVATKDFYARCIRCGLCYYACNYMGYHAIRLAGLRDGFSLLGAPTLDNLLTNPCTLCMECVKVCPTGALAETPEDGVSGVAIIDPDLCLAWNSGDCKSCAKACPYGSEVFEFTFNEWGIHTRVKAKVVGDKVVTPCRGCGLCVQACPIGGSAIHILPRDEYIRRVKNYKNTGMSYEEYLQLILKTEQEDTFKATWRSAINIDYIMNVRGLEEEKIQAELAPAEKTGKGSPERSMAQ